MHVLLNPQAGPGADPADLVEHVRAELLRRRIAAQVEGVGGDRLRQRLRQLMADAPPVVVVGGGDGSLSAAANALAGTSTALGVLPLGTFNHFALDAGLPAELSPALDVLQNGPTRAVDLGEVNGHCFLNTCSIGGYVAALQRREALRRRAGHGKWRAMFWAVLATLRQVPRVDVQLHSAERQLSLRASFVLLTNNPYQDDRVLSGRRAGLASGKLGVYASRAHRVRDLLQTALDVWRHGISAATHIETWSTPQLQLSSRQDPLAVALDGEPVALRPPLQLRSRPGALRIIAPPP